MDQDDVDMDMTPMIDVAFQLLIFFLLTINFKLQEGNLSSHLPKQGGKSPSSAAEELSTVKIKLEYDSAQAVTTLLVDGKQIGSWPDGQEIDEGGDREKIGDAVQSTYRSISQQSGADKTPVKIEVLPTVPAGRAITTVDIVNEYVIQPEKDNGKEVPLKFKGASPEAIYGALQ